MDLTQIATELPAVAAIVIIIVLFQKSQARRDDAFLNIITNHIEHSTKATEENTKALSRLKTTMSELCTFVKRLNGKK